jgi:hypothetical protein
MLDRLKTWFQSPAPAQQIDIDPLIVVEGADEIMAFIVRDCFVNGDAAYEVNEDGTLRRIDLSKKNEEPA